MIFLAEKSQNINLPNGMYELCVHPQEIAGLTYEQKNAPHKTNNEGDVKKVRTAKKRIKVVNNYKLSKMKDFY